MNHTMRQLGAQVDARIWRRDDAFARKRGWQVDRGSWGGRRYRDPRFDDLPALPRAEGAGGGSEPPNRFIAGDGFPRNHPRIPRARDLVAFVGMLWRWRIELAVPVVAIALVDWIGPQAAAIVGGTSALAGAAVPPLKRLVGRLVVRHRFQGLCLRTSLRTAAGRLPLVVRTSGTREGVVMLIWLRSGMSVELFEDYIPEIKVACFAREVRIFPHYRWPHLLTMELIRA